MDGGGASKDAGGRHGSERDRFHLGRRLAWYRAFAFGLGGETGDCRPPSDLRTALVNVSSFSAFQKQPEKIRIC
ncbi:hypothetical protein Cni_G26309 [Canna indica]|uniref:Uncharacterized protein n=1 Tax=Canna indica TaxID=4628 RepID=A0AAQ3L3G8_9LILI|nr:hypothetical protein Cni_G26309 [Canna indica]